VVDTWDLVGSSKFLMLVADELLPLSRDQCGQVLGLAVADDPLLVVSFGEYFAVSFKMELMLFICSLHGGAACVDSSDCSGLDCVSLTDWSLTVGDAGFDAG
jgi:hypothetical protein